MADPKITANTAGHYHINHYNTEFELGLAIPQVSHATHNKGPFTTYNAEAVRRYRAESIDEVLGNPGLLAQMIKHHLTYQVPRLNILGDYYLGNNCGILAGKRRMNENKSDHRIRHSLAASISDFINSYVLTHPVKIDDGREEDDPHEVLDSILDFNKLNDIDSHNIEIGRDQNNYGRAYELLHRTAEGADKVYLLDPREVFMIRDLTVSSRVIGAVRYYILDDYQDPTRAPMYLVDLYTVDKIYHYSPVDLSGEEPKLELDEAQTEEHLFGGVPIIEYRSNRYYMGVFEPQLSLIDAYDAVESDTANYMTDLNDAILVIEGAFKNAGNADYIKNMVDANVIILDPPQDLSGSGPQGKVSAHYLVKSYDVAGVEAYKTRLKEDIYSLAHVPNLSDNSFSGNRSGEALKYKLYGLQQVTSDKEKFLIKGFRVRYQLLTNLKRAVSELSEDVQPLTYTFTANRIDTRLEELESFTKSGGDISNRTKLEALSFVQDPLAEEERLEEERQPLDVYGDLKHNE